MSSIYEIGEKGEIWPMSSRMLAYPTVVKMSEKRTNQQNNAIHKYFEMLADALNEKGLDMRKTLKEEIEIPWTKESVKTHLWKPILEAMTNETHTANMNTTDPAAVYETLNRHLASKFGLFVPFPSKQD